METETFHLDMINRYYDVLFSMHTCMASMSPTSRIRFQLLLYDFFCSQLVSKKDVHHKMQAYIRGTWSTDILITYLRGISCLLYCRIRRFSGSLLVLQSVACGPFLCIRLPSEFRVVNWLCRCKVAGSYHCSDPSSGYSISNIPIIG